MKLQVACVILILVITSAKNSCCFPGQTENPPGLLRQQMEPIEETQGPQAPLRRAKRCNSQLPNRKFRLKVPAAGIRAAAPAVPP
ncbi:unnamed protein product, partial [Natator depressus]